MNDVRVIAYFAGDPTRTYQLAQWLEVLEVLDRVHPVGLVLRDAGKDLPAHARDRRRVEARIAQRRRELGGERADHRLLERAEHGPQLGEG